MQQHQKYFNALCENDLTQDRHVEHLLNHISDLIQIKKRTKEDYPVEIAGEAVSLELLEGIHEEIRKGIAKVIRWGCRPSANGQTDELGTRENPIVDFGSHRKFVRVLYDKRRSGLDRRPPIPFFTTNYDTLLEDALSLERVQLVDGFQGGATGFWEQNSAATNAFSEPFSATGSAMAKVYKLHGSIDWYRDSSGQIYRKRDPNTAAGLDSDRVLIYPQATKFENTQRRPFNQLFKALSPHRSQNLNSHHRIPVKCRLAAVSRNRLVSSSGCTAEMSEC